MKSVTEFPSFILVKGNEAKAALVAEGKTPEEVQESLGVTFKYEGDKLKYFINALDVSAKNANGLARVMIMRLNEGEAAPAQALAIEELYYIPEFRIVANAHTAHKQDKKGGRGRGRQERGPKESPWGLSPEQKLAKRTAEKTAAARKG